MVTKAYGIMIKHINHDQQANGGFNFSLNLTLSEVLDSIYSSKGSIIIAFPHDISYNEVSWALYKNNNVAIIK